jgi:hypothetical protein
MAVKRINQLIPVVKASKPKNEKFMGDVFKAMQKNTLLLGLSKTYRSKSEDGDKLPSETQKVQLRIPEVLVDIRKSIVETVNVVASLDNSNCTAKADIEVDGRVIAKDVPATHLLWLEKRLSEWAGFIQQLPTLDVTETWHWDAAQNCYATEPVETIRQKKVEEINVIQGTLTKEHPAQVAKSVKDVLEGYWTTVKFSGALQATDVKALADRLEKLQRAVRIARQDANSLPVVELNIGSTIVGYLFDGK